jgi:ribosome-associated protein
MILVTAALSVPPPLLSPYMSRKPKKGYFVKGQFVAEGSELDLQLKAELKGTWDSSKTDLKREMDALQDLGKNLLGLRADLFARLDLPETLVLALNEAKRITNFEGKRRQMQFVGKLMRRLDETQVNAINSALDEQFNGSASERVNLHLAEQWRDRLIAQESALSMWLDEFPATDTQQIRALIRQSRKDAAAAQEAAAAAAAQLAAATPDAAVTTSAPAALPKGRAYRELFALVREMLIERSDADPSSHDSSEGDD